MLDVCQADARDCLLLDIQMKDYKSGVALGGKGPSYADQRKNRHAREVSKAKRLGREMFHDENCGHFVDPGSSHCPRAVLPLPLKRIVVILPLRHFPYQITQLQMHNVEVSFTPHPRVVEGISVASTAQYGDSFFHTTPSSSGGHSVITTVQYGSSFIHTTPSSSGGFSTASNAQYGGIFFRSIQLLHYLFQVSVHQTLLMT